MSLTSHDSRGGVGGLLSGDLDQAAVNRYFGRVVPVFGLMLLVTAATIYASIETGFASRLYAEFGLLALGGLLVVQLVVFFGARAFRKFYPLNAAFAVAFAVFEGVFVAPMIAAFLDAGYGYLIGQALAITVAVFVGMSAIPLVTGKDFRFLRSVLFAGLFGVIAISLFSLFVGLPSPVMLAVDVFSVLLFSAFVLYDMSSILEDDFGAVSGAMLLYLDFVLIFVHLLGILAELEG